MMNPPETRPPGDTVTNDTKYDVKVSGKILALLKNVFYHGFPVAAAVSPGTVTANTPPLTLTETWNAGGVAFQGIVENITDTASAVGSSLIDLRVGGASKFTVDKAGTFLALGGVAFPAGQVAGRVHFRTDKKCWYYDDGAKWNIVGVEQTIETAAAPVQTINSTTAADITSSSITVTTTGAGAIVVSGFCRCNTISGTLVLQCSINGTLIPVDPTQSDTVDATIAFAHRVAVTAAGAYTVKLTGKMAVAATSATVTSFGYVTMAVAA